MADVQDQDYQDYLDYQEYQKAQGASAATAMRTAPPQIEDNPRTMAALQGIDEGVKTAIPGGVLLPNMAEDAAGWWDKYMRGSPLQNTELYGTPDPGAGDIAGRVATDAAKSVGSEALHVGGGMAATLPVDALLPESFGTSAIAIPAAYTAGSKGGDMLAEKFGWRDPVAGENSPMEWAKEFGENALVPAGLATADRVMNRGVLGSIPGVRPRDGTMYDNRAISQSNEAANISGGGFEPLSTDKTLRDPAAYEELKSADPANAQMGAYSGASKIVTDPNDPNFGKFYGGTPVRSATEFSAALQDQMPGIMKARGEAATAYDQAFTAIKQNDPTFKGVTQSDVFDRPLPNSDGSFTSLQEFFDQKMDSYKLGGHGEKAQKLQEVYDQLQKPYNSLTAHNQTTFGNGINTNDLSPSEAMSELQNQYSTLRELRGFNPATTPAAAAEASKEAVPFLLKAQAATRGAMYDSFGKVYQNNATISSVGASLPKPDTIQTLNEMFHNLNPLDAAVADKAREISSNLNKVPISAMKAGGDAQPTHNVISPWSKDNPANAIASKAINSLEDPQFQSVQDQGRILDQNRTAFGNAQSIVDLKGNPRPQIPLANSMPGSMDPAIATAAGGATVDQLRSKIQSTIADAGSGAPPQSPLTRPSALAVPLAPTPVDKSRQQVALPRNVQTLDPNGVSMLLAGVAAPKDVMPLITQWRTIAASGDRERMANFLGVVSSAYPDFPFQRGAITGLPSEFDLGDGKTRLFTNVDKDNWEKQIDTSTLRADEKAQRITSLRQHGLVVPMTTRVNTAPETASQSPVDTAYNNFMAGQNFAPRKQSPLGTRRVDD